MTIVYRRIIIKFIRKILCRKQDTLSLNLINDFAEKRIKKSEINTDNIEEKKLNKYWYLIIKNYMILDKLSVSNNYVTIPQYIGICWYVSILTGMCYSDASRNLIKSNLLL